MFRVASENNIDVTEFVRKCKADVVPTVTIKTKSETVDRWQN